MNRLNESHFSFKCPMNLEDMQATAHGHFCGKCQKEIFDLTDCSLDEIRILEKKYVSICGSIRIAQAATVAISLVAAGCKDKREQGQMPIVVGLIDVSSEQHDSHSVTQPKSADEALGSFQLLWKDNLDKHLATSPHIAQLRQQVYEKGKVTALETQSAVCMQRIASTLTTDEKNRLIVFGRVEDLEPDRKIWAISNPGEFGNGFQAYLDQATGKLILLWIVPEG